MGFFDKRESTDFAAEGNFLTGAEKKDLVAAGTPFTITNIRKEANPFDTDGGERFVVVVDIAGEARKFGFVIGSGVDTRDDQLAKALDYLAEGNTLDEKVRLVQVGERGAYLLEKA